MGEVPLLVLTEREFQKEVGVSAGVFVGSGGDHRRHSYERDRTLQQAHAPAGAKVCWSRVQVGT